MYCNRKNDLRFLTLTSSPDSPGLRESWKEFKRRVVREFGRFDYIAVFTDEGYGVIHAIYVGEYMPFLWIQQTWKDIHGAFHVNVRKVRGNVYNASGLAGYFLAQYVRDQNAIRWISQSRTWVYQGYMKDWNKLKRECKRNGSTKYQLIAAWHLWLDSQCRDGQGK